MLEAYSASNVPCGACGDVSGDVSMSQWGDPVCGPGAPKLGGIYERIFVKVGFGTNAGIHPTFLLPALIRLPFRFAFSALFAGLARDFCVDGVGWAVVLPFRGYEG